MLSLFLFLTAEVALEVVILRIMGHILRKSHSSVPTLHISDRHTDFFFFPHCHVSVVVSISSETKLPVNQSLMHVLFLIQCQRPVCVCVYKCSSLAVQPHNLPRVWGVYEGDISSSNSTLDLYDTADKDNTATQEVSITNDLAAD